jgi:hypothetical protein
MKKTDGVATTGSLFKPRSGKKAAESGAIPTGKPRFFPPPTGFSTAKMIN